MTPRDVANRKVYVQRLLLAEMTPEEREAHEASLRPKAAKPAEKPELAKAVGPETVPERRVPLKGK